MSKRLGLVLALGVGCFSAGCLEPVSKMRQEAHQRWGTMRNDVLFELAEDALTAGDLAKARAQLQQVLAEQPENVRGRTLLAMVAIREKKMTEASVLLHDVASWEGVSAEALNLRGVLDETAQDYVSAAKHYEMAWRVDRNQLGLATAAIEAQLAAGDVDAARRLYSECTAGQPGTAQMYVLLAEIERADGDLELAAKLYRRAMTLARLRDEGDARWMALELAGLYRGLGRGAEGASLVRALWEDEEYVAREAAGWELARCLASAGEAGEALGVVGEVCGRHKGIPARRDTGHEGNIESAGRDLPYRGECDAMRGEVWFVAARYFAMAEEWERAWGAIERANGLVAARVDLLMLEAVVAREMGMAERSRLAMARWERLRPDDPMLAALRN